jgi:Uncharacterized enzyme of heme biosynthesis
MKKIAILLSLFCALTLTSCEGFLDMAPTNQADSSTCITSEADAQVMLNGLMRKLTGSSLYGNNILLYGDAKSGDFTIYTAGFGGDGLYYFAHTLTGNTYSGFWSSGYNTLLQANNIIVNVKQLIADGDESSTLKDILGEALTVRALLHFDLCRFYGKPYNYENTGYGVPIVTEPVDAAAQPLRNTVAEVYTQVVADLLEAAPLLKKGKTLGYINYYANQAILGKVYMYMDNFSGALTCFKNVIDSGVYSLYSPSKWVSSWSTQNGSESVFELAIYPNEGDLGGSAIGVYFRKRAHGTSSAYGNFYASTYWKNIMGANDVRWGIMEYDHLYGTVDGGDRSTWKDACYKYSGDQNLAGDGKSTSTAVNIKVVRLSEVYLLAAEAAFRNGSKDVAAQYLNKIAERDPDRAAWTSATITADEIFNEYRREMLGEGKVFYEAMRQNKTLRYEDDAWGFGTTSTYRTLTVDRTFFRTILPIAEAEINSNPGIGAQQNPGY